MALFICSYMFQGLALVDLADLKWGDVRDVEVIDKEKYANVCRCRKSSYICDVKWCRKAIGDYE